MRLIDAKKAEKEVKEVFKGNPVVIGLLLRWIRKQPTIDAEPVKHGRWIERPVNVGTCTTGLFCSECNFPSLGWRYNYCPNCGKKMDLEG